MAGFRDLLAWTIGWLSSAPEVIPTMPGLEFTLPEVRMHFTIPDGKTHFTLPESRMHFTIPEED